MTVRVDLGPVPIIRFRALTEKQRIELETYRRLRQEAGTEALRLREQRLAGYLPAQDFTRLRVLEKTIRHARDARSQAGRIKTLETLYTAAQRETLRPTPTTTTTDHAPSATPPPASATQATLW